MTTQTLPPIDHQKAPAEMTAWLESLGDLPCDLWEDEPCNKPAEWRVSWTHAQGRSKCGTNVACKDHLDELAQIADEWTFGCEHGQHAEAEQWRPL